MGSEGAYVQAAVVTRLNWDACIAAERQEKGADRPEKWHTYCVRACGCTRLQTCAETAMDFTT